MHPQLNEVLQMPCFIFIPLGGSNIQHIDAKACSLILVSYGHKSQGQNVLLKWRGVEVTRPT